MFRNSNKHNGASLGSALLDHLLVSALWLRSFPRILQYLLLILSEIQVLDVLLYGQFKLILSDDNQSAFKEILLKISAVRPIDFISVNSQSTIIHPMLVLAWFYFLIIFMAFGIILKTFCSRKDLSPFEANTFTAIGQFHLGLGFWVTNMILLDTISGNDLISRNSDLNLFLDISSLILIIVNYSVGAFFAIFSYNPFIGSSQFSTHVPIYQVQTFLFKGAISIMMTWYNNSSPMPWVFTISCFVMTTFRHYSLMSNFPYYEYTAMKITVILSSCSILISGMNLFALATDRYSNDFFAWTESLLIAFLIVISTNHFEKTIKNYFTIDIKKLKSQREIVKKVFALRCLFEKINVNIYNDGRFIRSELSFWGVFASIKKEIELLPLSDVKSMTTSHDSENMTLEVFRQYHIKTRDTVIKTILRRAIDNIKHNNKLRMILCCLSLQESNHVDTPIYYLTSMTKLRGRDRIISLSLHKQVQMAVDRFLKDGLSQEKKLDIRTYMDLESISVNFTEMIHSNSQTSLHFWELYSQQNPKMKELYNLNIKIEKDYDAIVSYWNNYIEPNRVFAKSLSIIYSIYLNLVRNAPAFSRKIFNKYDLSQSHTLQKDHGGPLTEANLSSPYNITFYASISKEKLGGTLYVSPNAIDLLGWTQQDLKGTNINMLIPSFMQKGHDLILAQHLKNVSEGFSSKRLYKNVITFIRDKDAFIIPCFVYLSVYPYVQQDLIYAAMIRLKKSLSDIILVDEKGSVEGFTKGIGELLDLKISKPIKIRDICENYKLVERVLQNLHQLMIRKVETDLKKVKVKDLPTTTDDLLRVQMEEAFDNVTQTIVLKFHPSGIDPKSSPEHSKSFSVKISGKKLWSCYFFVLKLTTNSVKPNRRKTEHKLTILRKVTEEKNEQTNDEVPSSPTYENLLPKPSQALLKVTAAATQLQKLALSKIRKKKIQQTTVLPTSIPNMSRFFGASVESIGFLDSTGSPARNMNGEKNGAQQEQAFEPDEVRSTASVSMDKYTSKLEKAVYTVPANRKISIIKLLSFIFIFGTVLVFIVFWVKNNNVVEIEKQNFEIVDESLELLEKISEMNKALRLFKIFTSDRLFNMTVDDRSRYNVLGLNVSAVGIQLGVLQAKSQEVNILNNNLRSSIYKIEDSIQKQFYKSHIPMFELENKEIVQSRDSLNMFDFVTKLTAASSKLYLPRILDSPAPSNPDIFFILSNTLGGILTVGENISSLLINDEEIRLHDLLNFIFVFIGIMAVFGFLIFFVFARFIQHFVERRNQLIDIIRRLEITYVSKHISWIRKFSHILEENQMDSKRVNMKIDKDNFLKREPAKAKSAKSFKKTIDMKGINFTLIIICLAKLIMILFIFSAYFVILNRTNSQIGVLKSNINLVITSNFYLYQFNLLSTIIYEYIEQNATTKVRNSPIQEEWNSIIMNISQSQNTLFPIFLQDETNLDHISLKTIAMENLCDQLELGTDEIVNICNTIASGTLQKGTTGLISYGLSVLQAAKSTFDLSLRSDHEKREILDSKDLVTFEAMMDTFGPDIIRKFMETIKAHVKEKTDTMDTRMQNIIITYICICLLLGGLVLILITRYLITELVGWRKMIRQIPWDIITTHKVLKNYIGHSSKNEFNQ